MFGQMEHNALKQ